MGVLGYDLLFFSNEKFQGDDADYLGRCRHYQVDGCVIISGEEIEPSIKELDESDIPCIGVDIELFGEMSGHIMSDNYKMSSKVVEHFYLQGLRDLGFIGGSKESEISNMREAGYRNAMESFGLPARAEWFLNGEDFHEASGYKAMTRLIQAGSLPARSLQPPTRLRLEPSKRFRNTV